MGFLFLFFLLKDNTISFFFLLYRMSSSMSSSKHSRECISINKFFIYIKIWWSIPTAIGERFNSIDLFGNYFEKKIQSDGFFFFFFVLLVSSVQVHSRFVNFVHPWCKAKSNMDENIKHFFEENNSMLSISILTFRLP
jgi:hypothetical protein